MKHIYKIYPNGFEAVKDFYVTHDQTEAMTLGTRIVVMKDGIVQQIASPRELYNNPVNLFVAGFIGSPQMNFVNAECSAKGGERRKHWTS